LTWLIVHPVRGGASATQPRGENFQASGGAPGLCNANTLIPPGAIDEEKVPLRCSSDSRGPQGSKVPGSVATTSAALCPRLQRPRIRQAGFVALARIQDRWRLAAPNAQGVPHSVDGRQPPRSPDPRRMAKASTVGSGGPLPSGAPSCPGLFQTAVRAGDSQPPAPARAPFVEPRIA